jgi:hypothetical protein
MERFTTMGRFIAVARSKRNATPRRRSSLPIDASAAPVMRATRRVAFGATPT